jgi:hypothetical protein
MKLAHALVAIVAIATSHGAPAFAQEQAAGSESGSASDPMPQATAAAQPATDGDEVPATTPEQPQPAKPTKPDAPARRARMAQHPSRSKDDPERLEKKEDTVAGGTHWRVVTSQGAVHVWIPPGYDRETAGTVIYVHGYYTDADGAWRDHELARQFKASHQNAMFIVPDAPAGNDDSVQWPALKDLRHAVARANIHLPDGPVVVMGHSGAFRTVMQWVDHHLVEQIILLDAMYAGESQFDAFIDSGKHADEHKLIVVGASTAQESAGFVGKYKFAVAREKMPDSAGGFSRREKNAKLLYVRSQYEHMAIVTSGKVIPVLLHLTSLKAL